MIQSFFFIPGNHPKLSEKLLTLQADFLIIDLEDSIDQNKLNEVLNNISQIANKKSVFVRPRLFDSLVSIDYTIPFLIKSGFSNFIIPKFRNINDLLKIEDSIKQLSIDNINFVLLIENPESLFFLKDILLKTSLNVVGIGFGSQDYCNETGMDHNSDLLKHPRFIVSGIAKAFGKKAIDIACMDINNDEIFLDEVRESENMGFDAKFVIHPNQLDLMKNYRKYSKEEISEAEEILKLFEKLGRPTVFVYKGKAIEPPHIISYKKITNWKN